jgi:hypothetical protein
MAEMLLKLMFVSLESKEFRLGEHQTMNTKRAINCEAESKCEIFLKPNPGQEGSHGLWDFLATFRQVSLIELAMALWC